MAEQTVIYVSPENLALYDELLKKYIGEQIAPYIDNVTITDNVLKFFSAGDKENPVVEITLPKQDLSDLMPKIKDGVAGNIVTVCENGEAVSSDVSLADVATTQDLEDKVTTQVLNEAIKGVNDTIGVIPEVSKATDVIGYADYIAEEKAKDVKYDDTALSQRVKKLEDEANILTDTVTEEKFKLSLESGLLCLIKED